MNTTCKRQTSFTSSCKKQNSMQFAIFQKPNTTESIIPNDLCHPIEYKQSTIRHLVNRMNPYPINNWKIKQTTLDFLLSLYQYLKHLHNKPTDITPQKARKTGEKKMISFKYIGRQTKYITNRFKNTNLKVTYKINNMNKQFLKKEQHKL